MTEPANFEAQETFLNPAPQRIVLNVTVPVPVPGITAEPAFPERQRQSESEPQRRCLPRWKYPMRRSTENCEQWTCGCHMKELKSSEAIFNDVVSC